MGIAVPDCDGYPFEVFERLQVGQGSRLVLG